MLWSFPAGAPVSKNLASRAPIRSMTAWVVLVARSRRGPERVRAQAAPERARCAGPRRGVAQPGAAAGAHGAVPGLAAAGAAHGARGPRHPRAVHAPTAGSGPAARRQGLRGRDGDGVGEVAVLPPAG